MDKLKTIFLFVLIIPLLFSSANSLVLSTLTSTVAVYAVLALIATLLIALIYTLGNLLNSPQMIAWSKQEVGELAYTFFLFSLVLITIPLANSALKDLAFHYDPTSANVFCTTDNAPYFMYNDDPIRMYQYAELPCHIRIAKNYMASLFYETANFVKTLSVINLITSFLGSLKVLVNLPSGTQTFTSGFSYHIFGFFLPISSFFGFVMNEAARVMFLIRFQEIFLTFFANPVFPVFLGLGFGLRMFSLTRKLGGLLIALALSLYFIFPLGYMLGDTIYNSMKSNDHLNLLKFDSTISHGDTSFNYDPNFLENYFSKAHDINKKETKEFVSKMWKDLYNHIITNPIMLITSKDKKGEFYKLVNLCSLELGGITFLATGGVGGAYMFFALPFLVNVSFIFIQYALDFLAKVIFLSSFFSLISVFATISMVRVLSPMLGGTEGIAGLTRLL